jgi:hypothetical protein
MGETPPWKGVFAEAYQVNPKTLSEVRSATFNGGGRWPSQASTR